jgi:hypothetical protein
VELSKDLPTQRMPEGLKHRRRHVPPWVVPRLKSLNFPLLFRRHTCPRRMMLALNGRTTNLDVAKKAVLPLHRASIESHH